MTVAPFSLLIAPLLLVTAVGASRGNAQEVHRREFYVEVKSTAPALKDRDARIYLREVVQADAVAPSRGVVLFVHGSGTPAEVSFDVPYQDYSWMTYLAKAGFDVFAADMTGYGRSTRPTPMNDPCNFPKARQAQFVPGKIAAPCQASFPMPMTTMSSDWYDIGAVVDWLRDQRNVKTVSLVGWSQGGPRTAGYAAQHPDKVARLVVLAPAYSRAGPPDAPKVDTTLADGSMSAQSKQNFIANWDRQVGCLGQYDPAVSDAIWADMLASDPVGASWGPGVRRAPLVIDWGFNQAVVSRLTTPVLMVAGNNDKVVSPERVRELYADLGSKEKIFIDLACSSHNAIWEKNHLLLFQVSLEWLADGKVGGVSQGMLRRGY
jgi:pimeloyl-ACP methyl ester carboxylesterase